MPNIKRHYMQHTPCSICSVDLYMCGPQEWTFNTHGKNEVYHTACIRAKVGLPSPPPPPPPPPPAPANNPTQGLSNKNWESEAKDQIRNNLMINAIRTIRDGKPCGLLEAKTLAEKWRDEMTASRPTPPTITTTPTSVTLPKATRSPHILDIDVTGLHCQAQKILDRMRQGLFPFLHGAPGAGKTTLMQMIAERAKLDWLLIPCSPDMLRSEILGSKNPLTGDYYPSRFFEVWTNGGIILFDEAGLAPGTFLNLLNAALANGEVHFPNGQKITRHKNCFIVFADNSNLHGDDRRFPERQDAGGAFRNRLFYIEFKYDEALERSIVLKITPEHGAKWHNYILRVREIIARSELGIACSPRVAIAGAKILADNDGSTLEEILEGTLFEGLNENIIGAIRTEIRSIRY